LDRVKVAKVSKLPDAPNDATPGGLERLARAIVGLSKKSAAALWERLARIDSDAFGVLITLTWPTWAAPDGKAWRQPWDRFRKRLADAWPDSAGVFRLELTRKGVLHVHALAYGIAPADVLRFRRWVANAWAESVRADNEELRRAVGSSVEVPRHGRAVQRYVAKYLGKPVTPVNLRIGRWWGVFRDAKIPASPLTIVDLEAEEAQAIKGMMDERIRTGFMARRRASGETPEEAAASWLRLPRPAYTRRVFTDRPAEWLEVLDFLRQPEQAVLAGQFMSGPTPHELPATG